ncbi:hypothetical protein OE88DRAFT_1033066 [Heliocybe sulcata]|uniref:Uncharacterized protein n=1 Tax=Heliocybe sulcata TaxID=5364 RepID=A0A5C3NDA0_9AGAM|nr:hypothetical protein OE88DRAFT_1033066 [Heliocybe sulcata]
MRQDILDHLHGTLADPPPELLEGDEPDEEEGEEEGEEEEEGRQEARRLQREDALHEWQSRQHAQADSALRAAQDEFYEHARQEWASRLEQVGLSWGEWGYVSPVERMVVEKALGMPVTRVSRMGSRASRVSSGRSSRGRAAREMDVMGEGLVEEPEELEDEEEEEYEDREAGVEEEYNEHTEAQETIEERALDRTASGRSGGLRRRWGTLTKRLKPALKKSARAEVHEVREVEGTPTDVYMEQPPEVTLTRRRRAAGGRQRQTRYMPEGDEDGDLYDEPYARESDSFARSEMEYGSPISGEEYSRPETAYRSPSMGDYESEEEEEQEEQEGRREKMQRDERPEPRRGLTRGESGTWGGARRKLRKRARPETGRTGFAENMRRFVGRSRSRGRPPSLT